MCPGKASRQTADGTDQVVAGEQLGSGKNHKRQRDTERHAHDQFDHRRSGCCQRAPEAEDQRNAEPEINPCQGRQDEIPAWRLLQKRPLLCRYPRNPLMIRCVHETLLLVIRQQKKDALIPQQGGGRLCPVQRGCYSSSMYSVPTSTSAEMKKASATLGRMTDAIVRVLYVVRGPLQASLPAFTHALHVYHRLSDSSSSLDEEAAG
ncbi:MAG: hypothetical protein LZF62_440070 [Nitrospira sp.]|nr:MAG: hypothetical protein LZF62_440070 [Nitrospira sp.]